MLDVLVTAVLRLSHAALGPMAERGHGGIINVSSVAAFLPRGTYAAAKAWVNSFSEWADNEYRPQGVTVTALCPGFTKTEFHERMGVKRGTGFMWLDADRLVDAGARDFDKGRVFSIPGAQYKTIAGVTPPGARRGCSSGSSRSVAANGSPRRAGSAERHLDQLRAHARDVAQDPVVAQQQDRRRGAQHQPQPPARRLAGHDGAVPLPP